MNFLTSIPLGYALASLTIVLLLFSVLGYNYYLKNRKYYPFQSWSYMHNRDQDGPTVKEVAEYYHELTALLNCRQPFETPQSHYDWQLFLLVLTGLQRQSYKTEKDDTRNELVSFRRSILDALLRGIRDSWLPNSPSSLRFMILDTFIWRTLYRVFPDDYLTELLRMESCCIPKHKDTEVVAASFSTLLSLFGKGRWREDKEIAKEIEMAVVKLKTHLPSATKKKDHDVPFLPPREPSTWFISEHIPTPIDEFRRSKIVQ